MVSSSFSSTFFSPVSAHSRASRTGPSGRPPSFFRGASQSGHSPQGKRYQLERLWPKCPGCREVGLGPWSLWLRQALPHSANNGHKHSTQAPERMPMPWGRQNHILSSPRQRRQDQTPNTPETLKNNTDPHKHLHSEKAPRSSDTPKES